MFVLYSDMFAVNEVYSDILLHCHFSQEWTKLEKTHGAPWPAARCLHAACCLNYGDEDPLLLMTGGNDNNNNIMKDAWLLEVNSGRWREVREV